MTRDEYVEALAREMAGCPADCRCSIDKHAPAIRQVLTAQAALASRGGPKLVEREFFEDVGRLEEIALSSDRDWYELFDAAPAIPGDDA